MNDLVQRHKTLMDLIDIYELLIGHVDLETAKTRHRKLQDELNNIETAQQIINQL